MHALDALAKIPKYSKRYLGQIKLVYIDPPFNTGQAFTNYLDSIEHSIWLTMLRDRLRQIKPLLTDDGSVWVHLDHTESHRCRSVLDEEFGSDNFVAEVAWQKADSPRNDAKQMPISQDTILVHRKSEAWARNKLPRLAASNTSRYKSRDGDAVPWRDGDATAGGAATHQAMVYSIQHPVTGGLIYPTPGRYWGRAQSWMLAQMSEYAPYELRDIGDSAERARVCGTDAVQSGVPEIMLSVELQIAEPLVYCVDRCRWVRPNGSWTDSSTRWATTPLTTSPHSLSGVGSALPPRSQPLCGNRTRPKSTTTTLWNWWLWRRLVRAVGPRSSVTRTAPSNDSDHTTGGTSICTATLGSTRRRSSLSRTPSIVPSQFWSGRACTTTPTSWFSKRSTTNGMAGWSRPKPTKT